VSIVGSVISGNTSGTHTGGLALGSTENTQINNTVIENNVTTASYGGGIAIAKVSSGDFVNLANTVKITDTTIASNTANPGDGLYQSGCNVEVSGVTFSGNSAQQHGGAVAQINGTSRCTNTDFTENTGTM